MKHTTLNLKPIKETCSILVNVHGPLDMKSIEDSINLYCFVTVIENLERDKNWTQSKEDYWEMKNSLKMEMILRNILVNDKNISRMTDNQLEGYLTGKIMVLTKTLIPPIFTKSIIKAYRNGIFLNDINN